MKRGPLGPGSRGRDPRRRAGGSAVEGKTGAHGGKMQESGGEKLPQPPEGPQRERLHAGRPFVVASIHKDTSELKELARTLGLRLVLEVWQNRNRPHPGTFLGRGKLQQLKGWLDEWKAGNRPGDWRWTGSHWVPETDREREEAESTSWGGWPAAGRSQGGRGGRRDGAARSVEPDVGDFADRDLLVIVDEDVRPAVLFNLEEQLGVEVWGRTRLILEIFSQHAHLREARLQVELAQLRYDVPMVHEAIHRKRRGERPGFMGGGEYGVADYEEFIKRRMRTIREELRRVRHDRAVQRKVRRDRFYLVSLAGYTNAGKSSLLSALTGAEAVQESGLFSTLGTMTRRLTTPAVDGSGGRGPRSQREASADGGSRSAKGSKHSEEPLASPGTEPTHGDEGDPMVSYRRPILVTDTVGFIRSLPSWLVEAFHATLEEIALADVVLLVADVSDPTDVLLDKVQVGFTELAHLDVTCPVLLVLNKADRVDDQDLERKVRVLTEDVEVRPEWVLPVSAVERLGLQGLVGVIQGNLPEMVEYRVRVAGVDEGQRLVSRLQGWGQIRHVDYGEQVRVEGVCDPIYWKDLQKEALNLGARVERISG